MKTIFTALIISAFASLATAGTTVEYRDLAPFSTEMELFKSQGASQFTIDSVRLVQQPTKISITPNPCGGDSDLDCDIVKTIESTPAVEVLVSYYDPSGDGEWMQERFRLNPATLPARTLNTITAKRLKAKQAKEFFALEFLTYTKTVMGQDDQRSVFCPDGAANCQDQIVYKPVDVQMINVSVKIL